MNRNLLFVVVVSFLTLQPLAQSSDDGIDPHSWGRVFFAPGVSTRGSYSTLLMGVGGEGRIAGGPVAASVDVGWLAPSGSLGGGIGTLAPGAGYYFGHGRTRPFVNGGYTLFFREGAANGFFFGGGINHWMRERWGLGFEVRDEVFGVRYRDQHFVQFRFNVLLR